MKHLNFFQLSSLNIYHLRSLENGAELFKRPNAIRAEAEEALLAGGEQDQKGWIARCSFC